MSMCFFHVTNLVKVVTDVYENVTLFIKKVTFKPK